MQIRISLRGIFHIHIFLLGDLDRLLRLTIRGGLDVSFIRGFFGMNSVPLGFREEEDLEEQDHSKDANVQPEEAAPANVLRHGTGDNRADLMMNVNDNDHFDRVRSFLPSATQSRL